MTFVLYINCINVRLAVYKVVYRDGGFLSDVLAGVDQASTLFGDFGLFAKGLITFNLGSIGARNLNYQISLNSPIVQSVVARNQELVAES